MSCVQLECGLWIVDCAVGDAPIEGGGSEEGSHEGLRQNSSTADPLMSS